MHRLYTDFLFVYSLLELLGKNRKSPVFTPWLRGYWQSFPGAFIAIFKLHVKLNTLMGHREMKNLETWNILLFSIHSWWRKRVKSTALLLEEEWTSEDEGNKKRSCSARSWHQRWEEKDNPVQFHHRVFQLSWP